MGCNNSKKADIQRSRVPTQPPQNANKNNQPSSNFSPPVSMGKSKPLGDEKAIAESFTDIRIKENEMFQNIINRTQNQSPGMLDDNDGFMEQDQRHSNNLGFAHVTLLTFSESTISELKNPFLFGLPEAANTESSRETLSRSTITEEDISQILRVTDALLAAHESIRINDEGIGQLVVQLPVVEAEE